MKVKMRTGGATMVAAALAAGAIALPATSAARTSYKLTCKTSGDNPSNPTDITSTLKCKSPLGRGKQTGKLVLPKATGRWTFKGGFFRYVGVGSIDGQTAKSSITLTKGTGRFKGCTAKGRQTYDLKSGHGIARLTVTCSGRIK